MKILEFQFGCLCGQRFLPRAQWDVIAYAKPFSCVKKRTKRKAGTNNSWLMRANGKRDGHTFVLEAMGKSCVWIWIWLDGSLLKQLGSSLESGVRSIKFA